MNDIFDFRRFGWYARKELSENWRVMALSVVAVITIIGYQVYQEWRFVHSINYKNDYIVKTAWSFAVPVIIGIMMASSFVWKAFSNKKDTFSALTLPISVLERFVFAWLVAVPFTVGACFLLWKILWSIAAPLFLQDFPQLIIAPAFGSLANGGASWDESVPYASVLFFCGSALFMLGAVTLGKLNFFKTLGICTVLGIALFWLQMEHLEVIFPKAFKIHMNGPFPFIPPKIHVQSSKGVYSNTLISTFEGIYRVWWVFVVPLVLYACVFFKLKEKEI